MVADKQCPPYGAMPIRPTYKPVYQRRQQGDRVPIGTLRAFCPNIYTVPSVNEVIQQFSSAGQVNARLGRRSYRQRPVDRGVVFRSKAKAPSMSFYPHFILILS